MMMRLMILIIAFNMLGCLQQESYIVKFNTKDYVPINNISEKDKTKEFLTEEDIQSVFIETQSFTNKYLAGNLSLSTSKNIYIKYDNTNDNRLGRVDFYNNSFYIMLKGYLSKENKIRTLKHEMIHVFIFINYGEIDLWFDEGLARYFEYADQPNFKKSSLRLICDNNAQITSSDYDNYALLIIEIIKKHELTYLTNYLKKNVEKSMSIESAYFNVYGRSFRETYIERW